MNQISQAHSIVGQSKGRPNDDFYPTPPVATLELLKRENFNGSILEPCCGNGAISEVLKNKLTNKIISQDLYDHGYGTKDIDFLGSTEKYNNIITNPPYNLAEKFVRKALEITDKKVAMLLKTTYLESSGRYELFKNNPPCALKKIYVFSGRLSLYREGKKMKNSGMISHAWFIWDHEYKGDPIVDWILLNKNTYEKADEEVQKMNSKILLSLI